MKTFLIVCLSLANIFVSAPVLAMPSAPINSEIPNAKQTFMGLRAFKTVLPGVLYRGGGSGGTKPMNTAQLEALCKQGFSGAGYLYSDGMNGRLNVRCQDESGANNSLEYNVYGFRSRSDRYRTLTAIHEIIVKRQGPMFVHCWNGWHASGEIAALALMQFCGWSGEKAGDYWKKNIGDQGNIPKYRSIYEKHIGTFEPFQDLKLSSEDQKRVCPTE